MLLGVAQDTMSHVTVIEELLQAIGEPRALPPEDGIRNELREARNLSAVHRDQRVLYWRLTRRAHAPRRQDLQASRGGATRRNHRQGTIAYGPPPGATEDEIEKGYASVGTVGDLLSLRELYFAFKELEAELDELTDSHRVASNGGRH